MTDSKPNTDANNGRPTAFSTLEQVDFDQSSPPTGDTQPSPRPAAQPFSRGRKSRTISIIAGSLVAAGLTVSGAAGYFALKDFPMQGNVLEWLQASQLAREADELARLGKVPEAVKKYEAAIAKYPKDMTFYERLFDVHIFAASDNDAAASVIGQAMLVNGQDDDIWRRNAEVAFFTANYKGAEKFARKAIELDPADRRNEALLGLILQAAGDRSGR
ncbi:MAG TPA: hypothetical protein V6D08_20745, partial [Candidatus Obscuribacterales bacterium]